MSRPGLAGSLLGVVAVSAASQSLVPLTEAAPRFFMWLALGAAAASLGGWLLRRVGLPLVMVMGVQLTLTAAVAHAGATGQWLPSGSTLDQWAFQLREALGAAEYYAPPVPLIAPDFTALLLLASLTAWLIVEWGVVVFRRPSVSCLTVVALFAVPQAMASAPSSAWWYFLTTASCVALLATSERASWSLWSGDARPTAMGRLSALVAGVAAVGIAIAPTLAIGNATWFGFGEGEGGGNVVLTNPMVDMRRDLQRGSDRPMVTVTTTGDPRYLRLSVLAAYDGDTWSAGTRQIPEEQVATAELPLPPGLSPALVGEPVEVHIEVTDALRSQWLPHYAPTLGLESPGDWRFDVDTLDFLSRRDNVTTAGLSYDLTTADVTLTSDALDATDTAGRGLESTYTSLPDGTPRTLTQIAKEVTQDAATPFDQAVALQDWLRSDRFTYDLSASPGNGTESILYFLSARGRVGYCEQFASTFAVLGRTLGLPTRVVVGFASPEATAEPNTWEFSSWDLHAWPEVWFDGIGWVRFEPTPQDRAGANAPTYTRTNTNEPPVVEPIDTPSATQRPTLTPSGRPTARPTPQEPQADPATDSADTSGFPVGAALAGALALVTLGVWWGPRAVRASRRRDRLALQHRPPRQWPESAWREVTATAEDYGTELPRGVSPRTLADAVGAQLGSSRARGVVAGPDAEAVDALARLTDDLERARYAASYDGRAGVVEDAQRVCEALAAGAPRRIKRRATWWPASWWRSD